MTREEQIVYSLIHGVMYIQSTAEAYPIAESLVKKGYLKVFCSSPSGKFFERI